MLLQPYLVEFGVSTIGNVQTIDPQQYEEYKGMVAVVSIPNPDEKTKIPGSGVIYIPFRSVNDEGALRQVVEALRRFSEYRKEQEQLLEKQLESLKNQGQNLFSYGISRLNEAMRLSTTRGRITERYKKIAKQKEILKDVKETREKYEAVLGMTNLMRERLEDSQRNNERARNESKILVYYAKDRYEEAEPLLTELKKAGFEFVVQDSGLRSPFRTEGEIAELAVPHFDRSGFSILPYGGEEGESIKQILEYLRSWNTKEYQEDLKNRITELRKGGLPKEGLFNRLLKENEEKRKAKEGGIGAKTTMKDDALRIYPMEGSAAQKAGLEDGDQILKINGKITSNLDLGEAIDLIRGKLGTPVKLLIIRDGWDEPREFTVIRAVIPTPKQESIDEEE